jgi:serine/threonine protein phosphatase PrpC
MKFEKWRYAHASVIGLSHLNNDTSCQDRFACESFPSDEGEILIVAVADGAGSTSEGEIGAEIACETFIEQIKAFLQTSDASVNLLTEDFALHWIGYFQMQIRKIATDKKKDIREFASTLVGAVIGKNCGVFYQVGDGGAVFSVNGEAQSYQFGVQPADSEYVNMTDFLTDETAGSSLRFAQIKEPIEDIILFSDGIYSVAVDYQNNLPHEPFLRPMIAPLRNSLEINGLNEKLKSFLSSPKLNEKTDDDKTIVLASRAFCHDLGVSNNDAAQAN